MCKYSNFFKMKKFDYVRACIMCDIRQNLNLFIDELPVAVTLTRAKILISKAVLSYVIL